MSGLPELWATASVGDLITQEGIFSDGDWVESKDQDPNGPIRLLQLADIGDGVFVNKSSRFVNEEKFEQLRCTEALPGDVLIARMPDPLGRACIAPSLSHRCITVVDVAIVRPGPSSVVPKWLMHFVNAPVVRREIELRSSGTTRRRISRSNLAQLELPVPPVAEQKRIADKLDAVLARVDACRERLNRVPAILKRFRQSVLAAATSGKLTEDWRQEHGRTFETWDTRAGHEVFPFVTSGSRGWAAYYSRTGARFVRIGNLNHDTIEIDLRDVQSVAPPPGAEGQRTRVEIGDILISITADIGMVGLVHNDIGEAYVNQHLCLARQSGQYSGTYLAYFLASPEGGLAQLTDAQRGATKAGLTLRDIRELRIRVPPKEEQDEIVRRVDSLFAYADSMGTRYTAARARVERLTPALLAKAFRGELVLQDPNDEPASVLLERIRAARDAAPAKFRQRKGGSRPSKTRKADLTKPDHDVQSDRS